jgi:hypothetical protein
MQRPAGTAVVSGVSLLSVLFSINQVEFAAIAEKSVLSPFEGQPIIMDAAQSLAPSSNFVILTKKRCERPQHCTTMVTYQKKLPKRNLHRRRDVRRHRWHPKTWSLDAADNPTSQHAKMA